MLDFSPTISIIRLNINAQIKRQRQSNWIQKQDSTKWSLQEAHLNYKDIYISVKIKG